MIDKIWYDWQQRNPKNAKSFFGGSVAALQSVDAYNQYPNGGPPFLNVSFLYFVYHTWELSDRVWAAEFNHDDGRVVSRCHDWGRHGYDRWASVLRLRVRDA